MRATFTTETPPTPASDPRAVFQSVITSKVYPVATQIAQSAAANTKHQGVAQAYRVAVVSAQGNKVTASVENNHPLFNIIEGGSRPHIIRPRNVSILRFPVGGRIVWAREVHHPGTRPYRPLSNAFQQHRGDVQQAIQEGVQEWLKTSLGGNSGR